MPRRTWRLFATICCILFSTAVLAQEAKKADIESVQTQISNILKEFDLNQQQKYIIDISFSSLHAMSAYSELLLWVEAQGAEYAQHDDLFTMVREALRAHVQLSAAGIPLSDWAGEGQPISLAYEGSLPRFSVKPDPEEPSTYKWRDRPDRRHVSPASIGQSFRAKSLFLYLTPIEKEPDLSRLLLRSVLEELDIVTGELFLTDQLGEMQKSAYVPNLIERTKDGGWSVKTEHSALLSQLSMAQGLVRLHQLLSDKKALQLFDGKSVAGKSVQEWKKLTRKTLEVVYASLLEHHFDGKSGSFFKIFEKGKKVKRSISLRDANMVVMVMNLMRQLLPTNDELSKSANKHMLSQAKFIQEKVSGNEENLPKSYQVTSGYASQALVPNFQMQITAMTLMLEAYSATKDPVYIETAKNIYQAMKPTYWSEEAGLYRSAMGYTVSAYDGYLFGLTLHWMEKMRRYLANLDDFRQQGEAMIARVLKAGALLQCETAANGEVKQLDDVLDNELEDVAKRIAKLKKTEQSVPMTEYVLSIVDQDGDSVPGCHFGGGSFGTAPVIILQTSVTTPFPVPTKEGKDGKVIPLMPPGGRL